MLLIERRKFSIYKKHYPDLDSDAFSMQFLHPYLKIMSFCKETSDGIRKCKLFRQASKSIHSFFINCKKTCGPKSIYWMIILLLSRHTLFKRKERTGLFPPYCDGCSTMTLPKLPWSGGSPVNLHPNCITNGRPVKFSTATSSFTPTEGSALKWCDSSLNGINSVQ